MKTLNNFFTLCCFVLFVSNASAQNKDRVGPALNGFLQTDFMLKFQDMKGQAETMVKSFQSQSFQYPPSDVARVQVSYDKTARRFNQVLETIKNDFLDNNKLKLISSNPEYYAKGLELEMYKLSDYYARNFQQSLADVTGNQIDGNPIILLLVQMISGISGTMNHFAKIKKEARIYDQAYLNRHLVSPFRFRTWEEVTGGVSSGNFQTPNYDPNGQNGGFNQNPTYDPNGQNGGFNQNPTYDPNGQNGGFNQNPTYDPNGQNGGFNQNPTYDPNGQNGGFNQNPTYDQNGQNGDFNQNYNQNQNSDSNWNWDLPNNQNQQMNNFDGGSNTIDSTGIKTDSTKIKKKAQAPKN